MPAKTTNQPVEITMNIRDDMKSVVKFSTSDITAPVTNVYIKKTTPGVNEAKSIKVTIEVE